MRNSIWLSAALAIMQAELAYARYPQIPVMADIYLRAMRTKARLDAHFFGAVCA